jgi:hypothetical protein
MMINLLLEIPNDLGLTTALLDPRYKNLNFLDDTGKEQIK